MKTRPEHDELWNDLLAETAPADFRQASLERTLAAARGHQRRRRVYRAGVITALPCALLIALVLWREGDAMRLRQASGDSPVKPGNPFAATVPGTRIRLITDAELFAMFPDRPVALIGSDEDRQFVLLDEVPKPSPPPESEGTRQRL
jgi:hypothetical protein